MLGLNPGIAIAAVQSARRRRNLLLWTQEFDASAWVKTNVTVTPDAILAPDGTLTADLVAKTGADGTTPAQFVNPIGAGQHWLSEYAKAGSGSGWLRVRVDLGGVVSNTWFDVVNRVAGTVAGGHTALVELLPDGWARYLLGFTAPGGNSGFGFAPVTGNGATSGGGALHLWGAQLERDAVTPHQRIGGAWP